MRIILLAVALMAIGSMPANAEDILLKCTLLNITHYLDINMDRVIVDGDVLSREVTITSRSIIYYRGKNNAQVVIDRSTGVLTSSDSDIKAYCIKDDRKF